MPCDLSIGNGSLLINFDLAYDIRDIFYPNVGQENHTMGESDAVLPRHRGLPSSPAAATLSRHESRGASAATSASRGLDPDAIPGAALDESLT